MSKEQNTADIETRLESYLKDLNNPPESDRGVAQSGVQLYAHDLLQLTKFSPKEGFFKKLDEKLTAITDEELRLKVAQEYLKLCVGSGGLLDGVAKFVNKPGSLLGSAVAAGAAIATPLGITHGVALAKTVCDYLGRLTYLDPVLGYLPRFTSATLAMSSAAVVFGTVTNVLAITVVVAGACGLALEASRYIIKWVSDRQREKNNLLKSDEMTVAAILTGLVQGKAGCAATFLQAAEEKEVFRSLSESDKQGLGKAVRESEPSDQHYEERVRRALQSLLSSSYIPPSPQAAQEKAEHFQRQHGKPSDSGFSRQ